MAIAGTKTQRQHRIITVNIACAPGTTPTVDVEPAHVSESRKDEICWYCPNDPNWKVDFGANSPFARRTFDQANNCSGPTNPGAPYQYYKYSVTACGGTIDPGVIVDR